MPTIQGGRQVERYPPLPAQSNLISHIFGSEEGGNITKRHGITDLWFPIPWKCAPYLKPGLKDKLLTGQKSVLSGQFPINPDTQEPAQHCHLAQSALGSYSIPIGLNYEEMLGRGGFGAVLKVTCNNGKAYALKKMPRGNSFEEECKKMRYIQSELQILRKIRHPHFVQFIGSYTTHNSVGILMAPVADCNLAQFLENYRVGDVKNEKLLATFFGCLATAIAHLHFFEHVRHKDIKPQNILVQGNKVLLTDFGLAHDWSEIGRSTTVEEKRRSLIYCAPEVAADRSRNSSSDIWSLGCVFLEMTAVLKGQTIAQMETMRSQSDPACYWACTTDIAQMLSRLRGIKCTWGQAPIDWVIRMLERDPDKRPTAQELRDWILKPQQPFFAACCLFETMYADDFSDSSTSEIATNSTATMASEVPDIVSILHPKELRLVQVEIVHNPRSAKNWISPDLVAHCEMRKSRLRKTERFVHEEQNYNATEKVMAEWVRPHQSLQIKRSEFVVAPRKAPFMILFGKDYNGSADPEAKRL